MKDATLIVASEDQTVELAARIAARLEPGDVIALAGPLGAGKTVFCRGLALGLGVRSPSPVASPTFVLLHEHPGPVPLYHFDFYRLEREREVLDLGFDEYFEGDGVCAVEWADKFPALFADRTIWISIAPRQENVREIAIRASAGFELGRLRAIIEAAAKR